jgi:A/G-specific adenine glycosylase
VIDRPVIDRPVAVPHEMRQAVLDWYSSYGRTLPFRATSDPYAILVSEAMAQQTQVSRVSEAWTRFMTRFPTVEALAASSPADVLRAWRGLGYNRRALALRRAAIQIRDRHGGIVPGDILELEGLDGVGSYTARAVAAIGFGAAVAAVDTNVRRVIGRVAFGGSTPSARELQTVADAAVPVGRAGEWTHALMDIGATLCRPRDPACDACPARPWCRYTALDKRSMMALASIPGRRPTSRRRSTTLRPSRPARPHRVREVHMAFEATSRWLRGRILDRLRDTADGEWLNLDAPIGKHSQPAVASALEALAMEGLAELNPSDPLQARLPLV